MKRKPPRPKPAIAQSAQVPDVPFQHRALFDQLRAEPLPVCSSPRCARLARWWPVLVFYTIDTEARALPCRAMFPHPFCERCKPKVAVYKLVTAAIWDRIEEAFAGKGFGIPERKLTDLEWFDRPPAIH